MYNFLVELLRFVHLNPLLLAQKKSNQAPSTQIPAKVLYTCRALQFLSKDVATRFVARLFATPVKIETPERELMMRESAKKERILLPTAKKEIQVYVYGYSKTKVLLVHGWAGRGTQLYQLADKILENKMMVISFDAPAHGLSDGKRTNMIEFMEAIRVIEKKYGPMHAAVGHSFGGMSLINAVAGGLKIEKLVTIGADNSIPEVFADQVKKLELKPEITRRLKMHFEKKHNVRLDHFTSEHQAKRIHIPVLVIHDSEDRFVPVSSAVSIRQKLENGELLMTHGLGHHRILRSPRIVQRIIEFLQ
jgi:pimeloyl-ACP methyl ester carboxylesterase